MAFNLQRAMAKALQECSGAVVVVEDLAFEPLPKLGSTLRLKQFTIRFLTGAGPWKPEISAYGPLYVDSETVFAARGGFQTKGYPLGWGFK